MAERLLSFYAENSLHGVLVELQQPGDSPITEVELFLDHSFDRLCDVRIAPWAVTLSTDNKHFAAARQTWCRAWRSRSPLNCLRSWIAVLGQSRSPLRCSLCNGNLGIPAMTMLRYLVASHRDMEIICQLTICSITGIFSHHLNVRECLEDQSNLDVTG